jgi:hypothetical protein
MANSGGEAIRMLESIKMGHTNRLRRCILMWVIVLVMPILCISLVSAWDITANNGKDYNATTQTVKIYDDYLVTKVPIADIKLDTAIHNTVVPGNDRLVAEVTFDAKTDYTDAFKKIRFYDQNGNEIQREIRYKVKVDTGNTYEHTELDKGRCQQLYDDKNKTFYESCENNRIKTQVPIYEWKEVDLSSLRSGEFKTLGLFTEVKAGDYVEWIPEWFGVEITEWATWQSTYNVGMVVYYKMNETSGTNGEDFWHLNNLTHTNTVPETSGKIGYGLNLSNGQVGSISQSVTGFSGDVDKSYCYWIRPKVNAKYVFVSSTQAIPYEGNYIGGDNHLYYGDGDTDTGIVVTVGVWKHICWTYTATGDKMEYYNDGVNTFNSTRAIGGSAAKIIIGNNADRATASSGNWTLDEFGFWNRTLTPAEISSMATGMTPTTDFPSPPPVVNLNATPVNYYNSTTKAITLNCSATDDVQLTSLKLILDSAVNATVTNASAGVTSLYLQSALYLTEGTHTWNCNASDGVNEDGTNVTRTLTIDTINPQVNITRPVSNTNYSNGLNVINFSIYDANPSICIVGNETTNFTISCSSANYTLTPHEGSNTWMVFANDTLGNWNRTTVTFFYDSVYPQIEFDVGTLADGTKRTADNFPVYVVPAESDFKNMTYFYRTGSTTNFIEYDTVVVFHNYTSMADGTYFYNVSLCDTSGNCNSTGTRNISIDTKIPQVNITYPVNGSSYGAGLNVMNFSIVDGNAETCFAGNETTNFSIGCVASNYPLTPHSGWNTWNVFANDTFGNWNRTTVTFNFDSVKPVVSFAVPTDGYVIINQSVPFTYTNWAPGEPTLSHPNLCTMNDPTGWYSANCSLFKKADCQYLLTTTCSESSGTYNWTDAIDYCEGLGNGWHLVIMNDTAFEAPCAGTGWMGAHKSGATFVWNNLVYILGSASVNRNYILANVTATDSSLANITINLYNNSGFLSKATTITSPNYYNFSGLVDGKYYVNATAMDSYGNYAHTMTMNVTLDTNLPSIAITAPSANSSTLTLPANITLATTVTEGNLDTCWHTINNGLTNITYNCVSTTLNIASEGQYTIRVYANDTFGNENSSSVSHFLYYIVPSLLVSTSVVEGSTFTAYFNVSATSISQANASINYNGATTQMTLISNNGTLAQYSASLTAPYVTVDTPYTINVTYNLNNVAWTSSNVVQTVINLQGLTVSNESCATTAYTFAMVDEENLTSLTGTIAYNFVFGFPGNTTAVTTSGNITNVNKIYVCFNSSVSTTWNVSYGELQYSATGYPSRRYYIFSNVIFTNTSIINTTLYLLQTASATPFSINVLKNDLTPLAGYYTTLLRWYPALNQYNVVEMGKTDDKGHTVNEIRIYDTDYRLGVYKADGTLVKLFNPVRFVCSSAPCEYSLYIDLTSADYTSYGDIQQSLVYNKTTKIVTFTWSDPTQKTSEMNLSVLNGENVVCSETTSSFVGVMTCNVSAYSGTQLRAIAYRSASPQSIIASLWIDVRNTLTDAAGNATGLVVGVAFAMLLFLIGIFNPIASIVLGVIGLIPAYFLGAISIEVAIGFGIIGGLVVYTVIKRSG